MKFSSIIGSVSKKVNSALDAVSEKADSFDDFLERRSKLRKDEQDFQDISDMLVDKILCMEPDELSEMPACIQEEIIKLKLLADSINIGYTEILSEKGLKRCSSCGTPINKTDPFCSSCGEKQE